MITSRGFYIPDISLRYRKSGRNIEQTTTAPNSGGTWWSLPVGVSYQPDEQKSIRLYAELPIYQKINGLQISTSFTIGAQLRYVMSRSDKTEEYLKL